MFRTTIFCLFLFCGPTKVPSFIMTAIVNTIYGMMFGWPSSNSGKKFTERLESKFYAATSVIRKIRSVPVCASILSSLVCVVFRGAATISGVAMQDKCSNRNYLSKIATARCCIARDEIARSCYSGLSTRTDAVPSDISRSWSERYYSQSTKLHSSKVPKILLHLANIVPHFERSLAA